jgi:hypothetical protein
LTGKEWTDRHSCRVPFKCGEINATRSSGAPARM